MGKKSKYQKPKSKMQSANDLVESADIDSNIALYHEDSKPFRYDYAIDNFMFKIQSKFLTDNLETVHVRQIISGNSKDSEYTRHIVTSKDPEFKLGVKYSVATHKMSEYLEMVEALSRVPVPQPEPLKVEDPEPEQELLTVDTESYDYKIMHET